jgi:hypothetical protein
MSILKKSKQELHGGRAPDWRTPSPILVLKRYRQRKKRELKSVRKVETIVCLSTIMARLIQKNNNCPINIIFVKGTLFLRKFVKGTFQTLSCRFVNSGDVSCFVQKSHPPQTVLIRWPAFASSWSNRERLGKDTRLPSATLLCNLVSINIRSAPRG